MRCGLGFLLMTGCGSPPIRMMPFSLRGHGSDVQLLLRRANASGGARPAPRNPSGAALENTYWKLTVLENSPIIAPSQQREPHFILHPANRSITGSGGCNRLTGSYELRGDRISFARVASTMMACVGGMEQGQDYLRALGRVSRWRITGQTLELFDDAGTSLARFGAVYMR
jgi:heat shock protein HslJ